MHNHDEQVDLDEPVRVTLEADHDLAWFPRDQRTGGDGAAADD
jgi:iron(III) transport system ATP-binding protein